MIIEWLKSIINILMLSIIVDMISMNLKMYNFIRLVMGFIVLVTMVRPIYTFVFQNNSNIELDIERNILDVSNDNLFNGLSNNLSNDSFGDFDKGNNYSKYESIYEDHLINKYKEVLLEKIKQIASEESFEVMKIDFESSSKMNNKNKINNESNDYESKICVYYNKQINLNNLSNLNNIEKDEEVSKENFIKRICNELDIKEKNIILREG